MRKIPRGVTLRVVGPNEAPPPANEEQAMLAAAMELLRESGENIRQTLAWYDEYQAQRRVS